MSELAEDGDRWMRRMHRKLKRLTKDTVPSSRRSIARKKFESKEKI
jgi:predicted transcriptional regulator